MSIVDEPDPILDELRRRQANNRVLDGFKEASRLAMDNIGIPEANQRWPTLRTMVIAGHQIFRVSGEAYITSGGTVQPLKQGDNDRVTYSAKSIINAALPDWTKDSKVKYNDLLHVHDGQAWVTLKMAMDGTRRDMQHRAYAALDDVEEDAGRVRAAVGVRAGSAAVVPAAGGVRAGRAVVVPAFLPAASAAAAPGPSTAGGSTTLPAAQNGKKRRMHGSEGGAAAGPSTDASNIERAQCETCFSTVPLDDTVGTRMSCGAVYCHECLKNYVDSVYEKPFCQCKHVLGDHMFDIDGGFLDMLDPKRFRKIDKARHYRNGAELTKKCPGCETRVVVPLGAKVTTCGTLGCKNPPYGWCIKCDAPITKTDAPHACSDERRAYRGLDKSGGIHPCPTCGNAAEKLDSGNCNHMTCFCGTRYCAACGHPFEKTTTREGSPTWNYRHPCKKTNTYELDGKYLEQVYSRGTAPS